MPESDGKYKLLLFKKPIRIPVTSLRMGLFNARSVRNKVEHIVEILNEFKLDVLCITETWLFETDTAVIQAALPRTYTLLHVPRSTGSSGGGVAVICHKAVSNITLIPLDLMVSSFEVMEVAINLNSKITRVVVIYRPGHPGTDRNFMEEFNSFLETFTVKNGRLLICGDFNY